MFLKLGHRLAKGETCGDGRRGNARYKQEVDHQTYFPWWRLDWFPFTWAVSYRAFERVSQIPQTWSYKRHIF